MKEAAGVCRGRGQAMQKVRGYLRVKVHSESGISPETQPSTVGVFLNSYSACGSRFPFGLSIAISAGRRGDAVVRTQSHRRNKLNLAAGKDDCSVSFLLEKLTRGVNQ